MDELRKLLSQLEIGEQPSFFEVMSAINEISNLWPDTRPASQESTGAQKRDSSIPDYPTLEPGESCDLCG